MKNLNTHSTLVLSRDELRSINGGGFLRDLGWTIGRAFGRAWRRIKNNDGYYMEQYIRF